MLKNKSLNLIKDSKTFLNLKHLKTLKLHCEIASFRKKKWWQDRFQDSIPNFICKPIVYIINTRKNCEIYSKSTIKTPA